MMTGDEMLARVDVRAVVAGVHERRAGDSHVYLSRARVAKELYDPRGRCAAYDGVVYQNDAFSAHDARDRVQLYSHFVLSRVLPRSDEGSSYIFVFDESYLIGEPGLLRVADRGVKTRVGNADDDIRLNGMLEREESSRAASRLVDVASVYRRVGTREINVLENAHPVGSLSAVLRDTANAALVEYDDLARLDIADELRADGIERAALGRDDVRAVLRLSVAERTEAVLISCGDHLRRRHNEERVRAFYPVHRAADSLLDARRAKTLLGDNI